MHTASLLLDMIWGSLSTTALGTSWHSRGSNQGACSSKAVYEVTVVQCCTHHHDSGNVAAEYDLSVQMVAIANAGTLQAESSVE